MADVGSSSDGSSTSYDYNKSSPLKQTKRKGDNNNIAPSKKAKEEQIVEKLSSDELTFSTLLPFKNHREGEAYFNQQMRTYTTDPPTKHFATALRKVMKDPDLATPQKDPLGIIEAWDKWQ
jgi:hypothetical protein